MVNINYHKFNTKSRRKARERQKDHPLAVEVEIAARKTKRKKSAVPKESIGAYLARGGTITVCPPKEADPDPEPLLPLRAEMQRRKQNPFELKALAALKELGINFKYQHPITPYILDFYLPKLKVALEIDGPHHNRKRA